MGPLQTWQKAAMVWAGAGVALLATGAMATFIPARRAADANPLVEIRAE